MSRSFKYLVLGAVFSMIAVVAAAVFKQEATPEAIKTLFGHKLLSKDQVNTILGQRPLESGLLESSELIKFDGRDVLVQYSVDTELEKTVLGMMKKGSIKYGAFVAMDATTGQVVAVVSHGMREENLTTRATFPSASVFKIVTAAAAIENRQLNSHSLIPVKGSFHTLYKNNVLNAGGINPSSAPRYARLISFADAFGKSVNSVFGKVGIFGVGPGVLREYAQRFFFNKPIPFEMPVQQSQAVVPDDSFGLAESASGFTRLNTMSPMHGAMIASAIANDGIVMEPTVVSQLFDRDGTIEYAPVLKPAGRVLSEETARQLRTMMTKTITSGTSRKAFSGYHRNIVLSQLSMGGKTGTLDGNSPEGRYDWFVGYAMRGSRKLAVAALCIHGEYRGIKAAALARKAFETYFKPDLAQAEFPESNTSN